MPPPLFSYIHKNLYPLLPLYPFLLLGTREYCFGHRPPKKRLYVFGPCFSPSFLQFYYNITRSFSIHFIQSIKSIYKKKDVYLFTTRREKHVLKFALYTDFVGCEEINKA